MTLTIPHSVSEREARRFVEGKSAWIEKTRAEAVDAIDIALGAMLPIEGRLRRIVAGDVRVPMLHDDTLLVRPDRVAPAIRAWVIERARQRARLLGDQLAAQLGKQPTKLTMRDPRSRWGSCTSDGGIMLSWRLSFAPNEVFDYVVAHEVAHLREMNHSPAFWSTVEELMPGYEAPRLWLRREGATLHRYRFD